jgi:uncharacterized membrane protein
MTRKRVKNPTQSKKIDPILYWASFTFAILGALDATYLFVYKLSSNDRMCLGNGGCATINYDPHSVIFGIPVALFGLLAYLTITGTLLLEPRLRTIKENGPLLLFGLSLIGVIYSAYLTYLELYVIHAVCPFCIASAVIITIVFILSIARLVRQFQY